MFSRVEGLYFSWGVGGWGGLYLVEWESDIFGSVKELYV